MQEIKEINPRKKTELLQALEEREQSYAAVSVRGALFSTGGNYYPLKLFFLPVRRKQEIRPREELDYGEIVLVHDHFDVAWVKNLVADLGGGSEFSISSRKVTIPKGYFRSLDDYMAQEDILRFQGGYGPLSDPELSIVKETRSYPTSSLTQWPTQTWLFQCREGDLNQPLYRKRDKFLPLRASLPAFPSIDAALSWWVPDQTRFTSEWILAFLVSDYKARICGVKVGTSSFLVEVEPGHLNRTNLAGKYYVEYQDGPTDTGDLDFSREDQREVYVRRGVQRFYLALTDLDQPNQIIDYRDYNWRISYGVDEALDIEYGQEDIEHWLATGENETTEFKLLLEKETGKEFLETVCAFSNTDGGIILLGVDDNGNPKGLTDRQARLYCTRVEQLVRRWIEPAIRPKIRIIGVKGKQILVATISKGLKPPYNYTDHGMYIRLGATDRIATREEVVSLYSSGHLS